MAMHDPTADACMVAGSELPTASAPTFAAPLVAADEDRLVRPGQRLGDFELVRLLGAGAFGRVFLARQISLDRQVALKVSANRGSEARTLASLEHDHIVGVFSETVDRGRDLRLLCMQYVPGTTLHRVIETLSRRERRDWSGRAILEAIDERSPQPALLDAAALRDRVFLDRSDFIEAVCWLGARLAEALAHAHGQGVLHRDLKPANILLNSYGRPLLADFNLALDPGRLEGPAGAMFGGTLAYMAPEHLDAFNPADATAPEAVDERSDIYSLGVVLFELLTGRLPFPPRADKPSGADRRPVVSLWVLAGERRTAAPSPRAFRHETSGALDRIIRRCLDPEPRRRYQTAAELVRALEGCRQLRRAQRDMPPAGPVTRATLRHSLVMGFALPFLPHVLAALVSMGYTTLRITGHMTPEQQRASTGLTLVYNTVVFGACILAVCWLIAPIRRYLRRIRAGELVSRAESAAVRRRVLAMPLWGMVLSCLGWLPGGFIRPWSLDLLAPPVSGEVYVHFLLSFTIAGLIAVTYNMYANQFLALRILYPRVWVDGQEWRQHARAELSPVPRRLRLLQLLAGLIPLSGCLALLIAGDPAHFASFRLLLTALIGLGMVGFGLAVHLGSLLGRMVTALTGPDT